MKSVSYFKNGVRGTEKHHQMLCQGLILIISFCSQQDCPGGKACFDRHRAEHFGDKKAVLCADIAMGQRCVDSCADLIKHLMLSQGTLLYPSGKHYCQMHLKFVT